jgi:hypothetical protein
MLSSLVYGFFSLSVALMCPAATMCDWSGPVPRHSNEFGYSNSVRTQGIQVTWAIDIERARCTVDRLPTKEQSRAYAIVRLPRRAWGAVSGRGL